MKTILQFLGLLILTTSLNHAYSQITIEGVKFPAKIHYDDIDFNLNGAGVRKKWFFKVYVVGLYLPEKTHDATKILNNDQPVAMRIHVISSMVTSEKMAEATREGFELSTGGNTKPLETKIDKFIKTFTREEIKVGDEYDLVYVPGTGVKSYKNGQLQSTIPGTDFRKALFGIWLSDNPVDEGLKEALLGID